ncbi:MAG: NADH-quinone oxidoreductase subunit NuoF [Nitrospirae bacterium]|nr:NADH-quinone oxidoreductase subunit NuoF [Nitrospirota bacterium]
MFTPVLTKNFHLGHTASLAEYEASGGYRALKKAFTGMSPADVAKVVADSGLRGRGGAGFPTAKKWSFLEGVTPGPRYIVVNADEMEPGTFKDRYLMENDPHLLVEGILLAGYASGVRHGIIFIRYEYGMAAAALANAIAEARAAGYIGENILGSGFGMEVGVHRSAGRYECGEETGLLSALEGRRANPRAKPPFPPVKGLWQRPTIINNVETIANVAPIVDMGGEAWKSLAHSTTGAGVKLYGVSGRVKRPGMFELGIGTPLRELIELHAGGMRDGYGFKACLPGGASTQLLLPEHMDVELDFESVARVGSRMGTGCVTVFDDSCCIVRAMVNLLTFFARESCGWCTPCRDGLPFVLDILRRIEAGDAEMEDLDVLEENCEVIYPNTFCAFAPGAVSPVQSMMKLFRDEVEEHIRLHRCPLAGKGPGAWTSGRGGSGTDYGLPGLEPGIGGGDYHGAP